MMNHDQGTGTLQGPAGDDLAAARAHLPLYDTKNRLKLGTFATNVSNGMSISHAPTSFEITWEHTLGLARQAEAMGLDVLIPLGRWRGFGGETNFNGENFETYTWAAGLAQATERIMVFATSHVPVIHPIVAAKQAATIDHISGGRFGLNIVMGWFQPEMEMFGAAQREHDERYRVGEEWLTIIKHLWTDEQPLSFDGEFFTIVEAEAWPKPIQQPHPVIMNAGSSPAGSDFSARNADVSFVTVDDPATARPMVDDFKRLARDRYGRDPKMFSGAYVVCRDTEAEAQDALREILEKGDRQAAKNLMSILGVQSRSFDDILAQKSAEDRFIAGWSAPTFVGTPEQIAERFVQVSEVGVDGMMLGFLDYASELAYFDENVMPLLRQAGLRG
ncbi:FMNH(2)-dependent dimethylsulfone monooxygenase [Paraconexibacter sp. AEG42_29]|uniref:FMNH(2)-dependent dimethylsulfone monooxygenase n=1 Tax=Paraconexibacter sp. AEG42_29 TaxID=2997339 RepID=A0AAU7AU68_9ACTN